MTSKLNSLPGLALMAAGFITYLSAFPEDFRRNQILNWEKELKKLGFCIDETNSELDKTLDNFSFDLKRFLSTECEQLTWRKQGLSPDQLSGENAVVLTQVIHYF